MCSGVFQQGGGLQGRIHWRRLPMSCSEEEEGSKQATGGVLGTESRQVL